MNELKFLAATSFTVRVVKIPRSDYSLPIKKFAAGGDKFFSFYLAFSSAAIHVFAIVGIAVLVVNADAQSKEQ